MAATHVEQLEAQCLKCPSRPPAGSHPCQADIDALYADPSGLRFLHTAMHPGNVGLHRGSLALIDFDDSMWCYPIQDLGIALYALEWWAPGERAKQVFHEGYTNVRAWPEAWKGQVDGFMIARALDMLSLGLQHENEGYSRLARRTLDWLEARLAP